MKGTSKPAKLGAPEKAANSKPAPSGLGPHQLFPKTALPGGKGQDSERARVQIPPGACISPPCAPCPRVGHTCSLECGRLSHHTKGPQPSTCLGLRNVGTGPGPGGHGAKRRSPIGLAQHLPRPQQCRSGSSGAGGQAEDLDGYRSFRRYPLNCHCRVRGHWYGTMRGGDRVGKGPA